MRRRTGGALLALFLLTGAASAQDGGAAADSTGAEAAYAATVDAAVTRYILPAYEELHTATGGLLVQIRALCEEPSDSQRAALGAAFSATLKAWASVDFLRFGPMAKEARYERFAFFPDVHGTGARQLRRFLASKDEALLEPGALARQSAAVQGLPALESLLYSGSKALMSAAEPEPFRCALASAATENLERIATDVGDGWRGEDGWAELIRTPGPANPVYRTHAEALTEILKAELTGLEQVRDHRLVPALGDTPDDARASRAPYNSSGEALAYLLASADALKRFADTSGILSLVPEEQKWIAGSVAFEFANLKRALEGAGPDLEAALANPEWRAKLAYAVIVLRSLRDLFQVRLAQAAGITSGFNSLDGD